MNVPQPTFDRSVIISAIARVFDYLPFADGDQLARAALDEIERIGFRIEHKDKQNG